MELVREYCLHAIPLHNDLANICLSYLRMECVKLDADYNIYLHFTMWNECLWGKYIEIDIDTKIRTVGHYKNGKLHGERLITKQDGSIISRSIYDMGHATNSIMYYDDESIRVRYDSKHGSYVNYEQYYTSGKLRYKYVIADGIGEFVAYTCNKIITQYKFRVDWHEYSTDKPNIEEIDECYNVTELLSKGLWKEIKYGECYTYKGSLTYVDGLLDGKFIIKYSPYQYDILTSDDEIDIGESKLHNIELETEYRNGLLDGKYVRYNIITRNIVTDASYRCGKLHGHRIRYNDDGIILSNENYIDGILDGESLEYHANGNLIRRSYYKNGQLHGLYVYDGKQIISEVSYVNGKKHGYYRQYHNTGELLYCIKYDNDCIVEPYYSYNKYGFAFALTTSDGIEYEYDQTTGVCLYKRNRFTTVRYHPNGNYMHIITLAQDGRHKFHITYTTNGTKKYRYYTLNGKLDGIHEQYYDNRIVKRMNYVNGMVYGLIEEFDINGDIAIAYECLSGRCDGKYILYDQGREIGRLRRYEMYYYGSWVVDKPGHRKSYDAASGVLTIGDKTYQLVPDCYVSLDL